LSARTSARATAGNAASVTCRTSASFSLRMHVVRMYPARSSADSAPNTSATVTFVWTRASSMARHRFGTAQTPSRVVRSAALMCGCDTTR
jgi:hypothetical protein